MIRVHTRVRRTTLLQDVKRQLPFILSKTINDLAFEAQGVQRAHMQKAFTVRRDWTLKAIKVLKSHKSDVPIKATILTDPPGGRGSDIVAKFERPGTKTARDRGTLAVPEKAALGVGEGQVVPTGKRPKAFDFVLVSKGGPKGAMVYRSRKGRYFMIRYPDGTGGIYQRIGRRARGRRRRGGRRRLVADIVSRRVRDMNIKRLYGFTPSATIQSRLRMVENVQGTVKASFARTFNEALRRALSSSRATALVTGGQGTAQQRRVARADVFDADRVPRRQR
jgi:hypothetical protein